MDVEVITRDELEKLPEYSCSLPTGQTIGKRWRRLTYYGTNKPIEQREWIIGEYTKHPDDDKVGIRWVWAVNADHDVHRGEDAV